MIVVIASFGGFCRESLSYSSWLVCQAIIAKYQSWFDSDAVGSIRPIERLKEFNTRFESMRRQA